MKIWNLSGDGARARKRRRPVLSAALMAVPVALFLGAGPARAADVQSAWINTSTPLPDDKVQNDEGGPGWHMNLGPTGIRARLVDKNGECKDGAEGSCFDVKYVFPKSPAEKKILPGDRIVGVNGRKFQTLYRIGYWAGTGYDGPPMEFGEALEASEAGGKGKLDIMVVRADKPMTVSVQLQSKGAFAKTFPFGCKKSELLAQEACEYLVKKQDAGGRWPGGDDANVAVAMALLAQGDKTYHENVKRLLDVSLPRVQSQTWNWQLALYSILSAEYVIATKDKSHWKDMERFNDLFKQNQAPNHLYFHMGYAFRDPGCYGSMFACSSLACLGWSMLEKAGIAIHTDALNMSLQEMDMAASRGGYGYGFPVNATPTPFDAAAVPKGFHCIGTDVKSVFEKARGGLLPTSAMCLTHYIRPWQKYSKPLVNNHLIAIARGRPGIPNGHGSGALHLWWNLTASACGSLLGHEQEFRLVMDYHKAYLNLARCHDGTFYLQPQRDPSAGDYYRVPRDYPTALWALVLSTPRRNLMVLGKGSGPGADEFNLACSLWNKVEENQAAKNANRRKAYALLKMARQLKHPFAEEQMKKFAKEYPSVTAATVEFGVTAREDRKMRAWSNSVSRATVQASLVSVTGDKVVLRQEDGSKLESRTKALGKEDQLYIEEIRRNEYLELEPMDLADKKDLPAPDQKPGSPSVPPAGSDDKWKDMKGMSMKDWMLKNKVDIPPPETGKK